MSKLQIKFEPSSLNNEDFQILDKKGVFLLLGGVIILLENMQKFSLSF